jgi:hypothetical protein
MMEDVTLHQQQLKAKLSAGLGSSEQLLWSGMPDSGRTLRVSSPIFLFALPWTLFVCCWEIMALWMVAHVFTGNSSRTPWGIAVVFALFGIPFVWVGLWLMRKPFVAAARARNTLHAVTSERLVTLFSNAATHEVTSHAPTAISGVTLKDHGNGVGSLTIGLGTSRDSDGDTTRITDDWIGIPNARAADQAIRSLMGKG